MQNTHPKITGIILAHNNARSIENTVKSIKNIVSELILVDDFSSDETVKIVKKQYPKVKVVQRKLNNNFAAQRNFALKQATHEWVLMPDSDEVVTKGLAEQILKTVRNPKYKAYKCRRDNQYFDKFSKGDSGRPLLLKKSCQFKGALHENVYGTPIGYLDKILLHMSWTSFYSEIEDMNIYSSRDAQKWFAEKRKYSKLQLLFAAILMPFYTFFQLYFVHGKWKHGIVGFIYSLNGANIWRMKVLKFYEYQYLGYKDVQSDAKNESSF